MNRDGTELRQLVAEDGSKAWVPELSPNGEELLYTQFSNGRNQIFKVDLNSGVRTQLTNVWSTGGDWFDPAYALPVSPQPLFYFVSLYYRSGIRLFLRPTRGFPTSPVFP